jgi:alpha-1,3-rhamnosyl/mannosyltransferase
VELATALRRQHELGPDGVVLAGATEGPPTAPGLAGAAVAHLPGPRSLALARQVLGIGPRLERVTGPVDLMHSIVPFAPVRTRLPLVCSVLDLIPLEHPEWHLWFERWGYRRGLAQVARQAAAVVVISHDVARRVVEQLHVDPTRVTVVPLGVANTFTRTVSAAEVAEACGRFGVEPGRFFLHIGAVSTRKNLVPVARAAARIPGAVLLVAGSPGDGWDEVRSSAPSDALRLPGFVPDRDLVPLVAGARALVHPSRYEGFGLTPLEAMAAGTPAIVARAGALPEVVGDAAMTVEPDDAGGWLQAMAQVWDDAELRDRLAAVGRAHAATFTWDRTAAETLAVYRRVLSAR